MKKFLILFGLLIFLVLLLSLMNYLPILISNSSMEEDENTEIIEEDIKMAVFKSDLLGIKFNYGFPDEILFEESGGKIYINAVNQDDEELRLFIEVFKKEKNENIEEVLVEFMNNEKCSIEVPNGIIMQDDYSVLAIYGDSCGAYSSENRIAYFIYNPEIPERFVFVDNGQDPLPSNSDREGLIASETIEIF